MKIGVIGLGRMGEAIAYRLIEAGHEVIGFDTSADARKAVEASGGTTVTSITDLAKQAHIFWLMVPAGEVVDAVIKELHSHLSAGDIIIDGGNSKYTDSIRRAKELLQHEVFFLDCGTSGGVHGRADGFCLMVGGDNVIYTKIHSLLVAIAAPGGLAHVGPAGAGHYVKMVHNGIEYALLQAYAEGLHVIKEGSFKKQVLNLEEITRIWTQGSIIRSWILELAHGIVQKDPELKTVSGEIAESGMGKWTAQEAHKNNIPVSVIEESLNVRAWSRETGGNYATKLVAMLRKAFGGHAVKKIKE